MTKTQIALLASLVLLVIAFFALGLDQYFDLAYLKSQQARIAAYREAHPFWTAWLFFGLYVALTGLSLPVAGIMTLAAGAVFGLLWGTVIVSLASTLGATIAFLASRFLFRRALEARYAGRLQTVNAGIERDGYLYLFTLRLIPIFPFFVINLVMGLTHMRTVTFFFVSQLGMLAGTIVYVNAGTQLARIHSPGDILSPQLLFSFALLGLFPLLAKKTVDFIRRRRGQAPMHGGADEEIQ